MAIIYLGLISSPAHAQTLSLFGEIGDAPVFVSLLRTDGGLSGWYLYLRQAAEIRLEGTIDATGFTMDEFSYKNGEKTGHFAGTYSAEYWTGIWQSPNARQLKFSLRPDGDANSSLIGRVRCEARTSEAGYAMVSALDLGTVKGKVTRFSLSHTSKGFGEEHTCAITLRELQQIRSDSSIVLRAREDDENDTDEGARHCTLGVKAGGDYLVLQVNGCKGAGDIMFCSARGSWSDLVVNRKTQACKAVE